MTVTSFLQLIRWKNLVMIIGIQLLFKYSYFAIFSVATALNSLDFSILQFATITIAAAGYIINDIYDTAADAVNKPKKVIIGTIISKKQGYRYYFILNVLGLLAGFYVAYKVGKPSFIAIFIIAVLLLKVYNSDLKKMPVIGNFIVSLLVSLSILIVGVFDIIPAITDKNVVGQYHAFRVLIDYAVFAFMFMFLREIVKDIEDIKGDKKMNMNTLPILLGRKKTKNIVFSLSFIPLILVTLYSFNNFSDVPFLLAYMLIVVMLPLLYFMTRILYAKTKEDYTLASNLLKIIMLLGMLSIIVISFTIEYVA